jgi:hypothetical protein
LGLAALVVVLGGVLGMGAAAVPDEAPGVAAGAAGTPCPAAADVAACDADGDTIPDSVERVVAGTSTGATGREDTDDDGVPDWVEVTACGTIRCASATADSVGDAIPDFARQIVCGSATCGTGNSDVNPRGVPKWASVVICGTTGCATGHEDYDGDGISDAVQLAACVVDRGLLASTGAMLPLGAIALFAAGLIGAGVAMARRRGLFTAALAARTGC